VNNLINMMAAARHDILVIADADVHVRPDYLERLVAGLQNPGVGLVTTLYAGLPVTWANSNRESGDGDGSRVPLASRLGATQITHGFLPGAVVARAFGRQDCLGATMCLHRHVLESIGGFPALVDHLADDNVLGRRVAALGLSVALADTVVLTTVPETSLRSLFRHELRWARTIRALTPASFAASVLQYPLAWAILTILLSAASSWSIGLFLSAWVLRGVAAFGVDRALARLWTKRSGARTREVEERGSHAIRALAFSCPVWLLPLRDVLSVAVMLASYGGRQVDWRGHRLDADRPPPASPQSMSLRLELSRSRGSNTR
jgi:ceramide glucosyltransferase